MPIIVTEMKFYLLPIYNISVLLLSAGSQLINRVVSHPSQPVSITAHENRSIRFMDNRTGVFMFLGYVKEQLSW